MPRLHGATIAASWLGTIHHDLVGTGSGSLRPWFDEELTTELCGWSRHKSAGMSMSQFFGGAILQYSGEKRIRYGDDTQETQVTSATIYAGDKLLANKVPCRGAVEFVARVVYGGHMGSPIVGVTLFDAEGLQVTAMNSNVGSTAMRSGGTRRAGATTPWSLRWPAARRKCSTAYRFPSRRAEGHTLRSSQQADHFVSLDVLQRHTLSSMASC